MAPKGKYSKARVEDICAAIRRTGRDIDGIASGGISNDTFYKWLSAKPEFMDLVNEAKEEWRKTCPAALRKTAVSKLADYIHNGTVTVMDSIEVTEVDDGKGGFKVVSRKKTHKEFKNPVPQWVFDRILGKNLPLIEAVQIMMNNGLASQQQASVVESCLADMERQLRDLNDRSKTEQTLASSLAKS